ncbi:MAG: hypothetical protein Alis3KO_00960 [Aliiglaciecola sp.]
MTKAINSVLVTLIFASVSTFRRAGFGFTDKGTAFPEGYFNEQQQAAIDAEPRLSVKQVPIDAIPAGVDTTIVDRAPLSAITTEDEAPPEEKAPDEKAKPSADTTAHQSTVIDPPKADDKPKGTAKGKTAAKPAAADKAAAE